jgi:uncharacterized delta-60 repeat protein
MRRALLVLIGCAVFLTATAGASGAIHADPDYGTGGIAQVPGAPTSPQTGPRAAAIEPDGGLILATGQTLQRLDPTGHLNPAFGSGGTVTPPAVAGGTFVVTAAAVDGQGRIVVVGTSTPPRPEGAEPSDPTDLNEQFRATDARILRYLPDGSLDPTFGQGGIVETDFGLSGSRVAGKDVTYAPTVEATGVAVDGAGRIVATGGAAAGVTGGCFHDDAVPSVAYAALVGRLTESGELDTSFARGGILGGRSISENPLKAEVAEAPVIAPGDGLIFQRGAGHCARTAGGLGFVRLGSTGTVEDSAGPHALHGRVLDATVAADGSVVLLLEPLKNERGGPEVVEKLRPDGNPDRTFGGDGKVTLRLPSSSFAAHVAVATDGRILVQGEELRNHHPRVGETRRGQNLLMLLALSAGGKPDRRLGPEGIATAHIPGWYGDPDLWLDAEDRATVTTTTRSKGGAGGFAAIRFDLGR